MSTISEFIEALEIFKKYEPARYPFAAEHDVIYIWSVHVPEGSEDRLRLEELGWRWDDFHEGWRKYV